MKCRMANAGADGESLSIACDFVEPDNLIDIDEVGRLGEAERHDRDKALTACQDAAVFRCDVGQNPQRLVERLRHVADEGRGLHASDLPAAKAHEMANYLYANDKARLWIVKRGCSPDWRSY